MRARSAPRSTPRYRTSAAMGRTSTAWTSEAQYRGLPPQIDPYTVNTQDHGRDEHPARHREPQESPGHPGAFSGAGQHLDQHLAQGEHLEHEIEGGSAGRHAALGQALDVQVPYRHSDGGERGQGDERRIHAPSPDYRVVRRGDQENEPEREYSDALENAQRTGFQVQHYLRVIGVGQQSRAG